MQTHRIIPAVAVQQQEIPVCREVKVIEMIVGNVIGGSRGLAHVQVLRPDHAIIKKRGEYCKLNGLFPPGMNNVLKNINNMIG